MVRPRRVRRVEGIPQITYYKPVGVPLASLEEVVITLDELEAVRLTAGKGLSQSETAERMNVSQPTVHRLIENFEKKITDALLNGKAIRVEGGDWIMPNRDGTGPTGTGRGYGRGRGWSGRGLGRGAGRGRGYGGPQTCRCPKCGTVVPHTRGIPCRDMRCPKCGTPMIPGD